MLVLGSVAVPRSVWQSGQITVLEKQVIKCWKKDLKSRFIVGVILSLFFL